MRTLKLFVVLLFVCNCTCFSQSLNSGELMQNHLVLDENGKVDTVPLDKYKGKLLILDFWNRSCSSCIKQMPKIHALKEKYKGIIEIIPVTKDSYDQVRAVYAKQKGGNYEIKFPTIYADTMLTQKFGVRGYPTGVWLTEDGTYLASTYGTAINEEVIEEVLSANFDLLNRSATVKGIKLLQKFRDSDLERKQPLLSITVFPYDLSNSIDDSELLKDTSLYIEEYKNRSVIDLIKLLLYDNNDSFTDLLYKDDLNKRMKFSDNFKTKYLSLFTDSDNLSYEERVSEYEISRRSILMVYGKKANPVEVRKAALNMLELAIGHKVNRDFEESDVLVLKYNSNVNATSEEVPIESQVSLQYFSDLLFFINNKTEDIIVAENEGLYKKQVNLVLDKKKDYKELLMDLKKYGIELSYQRINLEMISVE